MKPAKKQPTVHVDKAKDTNAFSEAEKQTVVGDSPDSLPLDFNVDQALKLLSDVRELKSGCQPVGELPEAIGRYKILSSAGRGGFSEVFHALDTDLGRQVALKIPLIAGQGDSQSRFEREAQLAAMLSHRQIVPVYEYGNVGRVDYIAYGWVEGETLADWLRAQDENVAPKLVARIVAELARAMHFAHERGVVHRDLKPANILLDQSETFRDQPIEFRTRITDLGLSRNLADENQRLTQTGQALGTPAYMSPEQASGESDVGFGTDIYSLGILLFELLTGELPFRKATAIETIKSIHEHPAPDVAKYRPGISRELSAIIDKCLQKKPSLRYLSAFDLAEDLDAFVQGLPVSAKPAGLATRVTRWVARNRVVSVASSLVIFSLAIGLSLALWQWNNASLEKVRAEKHLNHMTAAVDLLLEDLISQNEPTKVTVAQRELLNEVLNLQETFIGDRDYDRVSKSHVVALHRTSQIFRALGQTENAAETFEELRDLEITDSEIDDKDLAEIVFKSYLDGIAAFNGLDQAAKAIEVTEEMNQFHASVARLFPKEVNLARRVSIENLRGTSLAANNQTREACKAHLLAQEFAEELIRADAASDFRGPIATNLINLAICQSRLGDQQEALTSSDLAIVLLNEELALNPDFQLTQNLANVHQLQAGIHVKLNQKQRGRESAKIAIKLSEQLTRDAPDNLRYVATLAASYSKLAACTAAKSNASRRGAIKIYDKLLALKEKGLDRTPAGRMRIAWAMGQKSYYLSALNELNESAKVSRQAVDFATEHFNDDEGNFGIAERYQAWSQHMNVLDRLNDSEAFAAAMPDFIQLMDKAIERYQGSDRVVGAEKTQAWALRRAATHFARMGDFQNALFAVEEMTKAKLHLKYPRVELARATSEVVSMWQESEDYPTQASKSALDRAFQWLTEAIVENEWSKPEFFKRDDMQAIVEDERFAALQSLMADDN